MVYPLPIFVNFQTNISKCLILWKSQSQIFVSGISLGPCRLGILRSEASDPGCPGLLCRTLHHCDAPLLSRSHRQAPQTRFACPNLNCHSIASLPPYLYLSLTPSYSFFLPSSRYLFTPPPPAPSEYSSGQSIFLALLGRVRARHPRAAPRAVALH